MPSSNFHFCLNTSTIRCENSTFIDRIKATAGAGYEGIEPWVREVDAFVAEGGRIEDLAKIFADSGLKVVNLIGFFDWAGTDDAAREKGLAEAKRAFEMAAKLSCPFVAAPPMGLKPETANLLEIAQRYGQLIEIAKPFGVVPLLEFWGAAKVLGKLGEAMLVAAESGKAEARILADVFHMYKGSGQFNGLELIGRNTIGLFHVNDYPADPQRPTIGDADRVYCGDGVAPLKRIFGQLKSAGFHGMLSLELFNKSYWQQDPLSVARTGLEKLKAVLAEV